MNGCVLAEGFDPGAAKLDISRWILGKTVEAAREVTEALETCAFDAVAGALYRFIWNVYCDWFVEFAKPILNGADDAAKAEVQSMAAFVLETILKLLHPVSPFITEELWAKTAAKPRASQLITAPWPDLPTAWRDAAAVNKIDDLIDAVREGRSVRAELNVPPGARPDFYLVDATEAQRAVFAANATVIAQTLRAGELYIDRPAPIGAIRFVDGGKTYALDLKGLIDIPTERARLAKEIAAHAEAAKRTAQKLANADFVAKAPEDVVEENRSRLAESEQAKARLEGVLARLEALG